MEKTAVEQFFEDLVHLGYIEYPDESLVQDRLSLALELEKQQHKKSFEAGEINAHKRYYENAEQYYSETYKKPTT